MRTINNRRTAAVLSASALVLGLVAISQPALAGISNTRHNLGSGSNSVTGRAQLSPTGGGTTEICVFCHTPHGAASTVTAPLWNKLLAKTSANYTSYTSATSITFDAQQDGPGNVSLGCLSCHDGTQAMDNILNAPGYNTNNNPLVTGANGMTGASWTWNLSGAGDGVTSEGLMNATNSTLNLGTNLSNDHPIGMNYCADNTPTGTGVCEADYAPLAGTASRRYVNTDVGGTTFTKTDFPLYSNGSITTKVECATCHDPHTESSQFLRMPGGNAGSQFCLACQIK